MMILLLAPVKEMELQSMKYYDTAIISAFVVSGVTYRWVITFTESLSLSHRVAVDESETIAASKC